MSVVVEKPVKEEKNRSDIRFWKAMTALMMILWVITFFAMAWMNENCMDVLEWSEDLTDECVDYFEMAIDDRNECMLKLCEYEKEPWCP